MRTPLLRGSRALTLGISLLLSASCHVALPPDAASPFENGYGFPDAVRMAPAPPEPPLRLTASDGTGLRLVELVGRAVVEEPLAFTELHLSFENPEDRTLEGTFNVVLPEGATLSRFAMKIGDVWQEGEVIEKQRAREVYEDYLHRKQDPALLEQAAGNEFSARVFPIPARARKELVLSYSQEIRSEAPYVLPLKGLPELGRLDVSVSIGGLATPMTQTLEQTKFVPDADFRLDSKYLNKDAGLRSGNLAVLRVAPLPEAMPDPIASVVLLVDTSASRALGFDEQVALVAKLVGRVAALSGPKTPISVACYDQGTAPIFEGEAGAFGDAEIKRIRERQAFGASNLEQALAWAHDRAKARGAKRVVVVSDGVATAGATSAGALGAAAKRLALAGVERVDVVAMGGIRDGAALKRVVTAGLARDGVVADGARGVASVERRLTQATRSGIGVQVEGAAWSWPKRLDGVQPGDEVLIYADIPSDKPVKITLDGVAGPPLALTPAEKPLLERAAAQAKIAALLEKQDADGPSREIEKQIVALSMGYRVLSPYTSLLVLENDAEYARFGIDRLNLVDLLTVDAGKIATIKRSTPAQGASAIARAPAEKAKPGEKREEKRAASPSAARMASRPPPAPRPARAQPSPWGRDDSLGNDPLSARGNMWGSEIGDSFGAGGLGLTGIGEGGGGRSEGIGLGRIGTVGHGAGVAPSARPAAPPAPPQQQRVEQRVEQREQRAPQRAQGTGSGHGRLGGTHRSATPPMVRMGATQVSGRLPPEIIQHTVRLNSGRFRRCYEDGLRTNASLAGRVSVRFVVDETGAVTATSNAGSDLPDQRVVACVVRTFKDLTFPAPNATITVVYPMVFSLGNDVDVQVPPTPMAANRPRPPEPPEEPRPPRIHPYTGRFKQVMDTIGERGGKAAIGPAFEWHSAEPGNVTALVALGEALEAAGEHASAARVYGSIVDLFPARADMRRFAGERLERVRGGLGLDLALDTYEKAVAERPDHPASHRLLAFAWLKKGDPQRAFAAIAAGIAQRYPDGRFRGVDRILSEDLGLMAAAWIKADPSRRTEILEKLRDGGGTVEDGPSLRFVLNWETDANDVDFHIRDADGRHAYYQRPVLESGGELYADVTTGYGPECFTIRAPKEKRSAHYTLEAHYYSRGPMGYGMGKLEIVDHDGKGGIAFEERPFVVMADQAFVDLGTVMR